MSRSSLLTALVVVAFAAPAQGDVWKRASEPADTTVEAYTALMQKGDDAATAASAHGLSFATIVRQVDIALESYRAAAKTRPTVAEPHIRLASVLYAFFFDCSLRPNDKAPPPKTCELGRDPRDVRGRSLLEARGREMLAEWDTFEAMAPLDPRVNDMLQTRAIERTKMVALSSTTKGLLEGAERDYRALLDRDDGMLRLDNGRLALVLGNLAETYMMLGDVEKAIETYIGAFKAGADGTTLLGLAVALDRDDRGAEASRLIREFGFENFTNFTNRFRDGDVFFVPVGEEQYYFALCHEAFGNVAESIRHWNAFVRSGAHPKFQPRAQEHLDKLKLRRNFKIASPISPDLGREPVVIPNSPFDPVTPPPALPPKTRH